VAAQADPARPGYPVGAAGEAVAAGPAEADASDRVQAQRDQLTPIAGGLQERLRSAEGPERTVMLCRRETISATLRFLDALDA
jgi:hypothetical protein